MERYRIVSTTDGKWLGKEFTFDPDTKIIDIDDVEEGDRKTFQLNKEIDIKGRIRFTNSHYTIKAAKIN